MGDERPRIVGVVATDDCEIKAIDEGRGTTRSGLLPPP